MGVCLIIPVGVTEETVTSTLSISRVKDRITCLIAVTVKGLEDVKRGILDGLKNASHALGFDYYEFWVGDEDIGDLTDAFLRVLIRHKPRKIYLSLLSGSRFLFPILVHIVLYYWRLTGAMPYILHGVEGGSWRIEPLPGFTTVELPRRQKKILFQIYKHPGEELKTVEDLIERYGYGRSIYKILRELEVKGLIVWRRNRIRKTLPGKILYMMMEVSSGGV